MSDVQLDATREALRAKIDDLAGSGATPEADLKAATAIRKKELSDFRGFREGAPGNHRHVGNSRCRGCTCRLCRRHQDHWERFGRDSSYSLLSFRLGTEFL